MDLDTAKRHIQACYDRMRIAYLKPVFDEWAILAVPAKTAGVVAYHGPRPDAFKRNLPDDAEPLRARAAGQNFAEGDIEFVPDAADTLYDAFMKIGPASYLILNHTSRTMNEIRADGKWLGAQSVLFELSEKFRADPLELE
ncbi:MAG TPA: hypothetical protein VM029_12295 [Opitutaceae bacterium]|nr:hypothetical protein [Opitutaceae bacterium]